MAAKGDNNRPGPPVENTTVTAEQVAVWQRELFASISEETFEQARTGFGDPEIADQPAESE